MSIEDEMQDLILDRVARNMLFPLIPLAAGEAPIRALFVEEDLWALLDSPEGDEDWEKRVGELRADLERFVTGEKIDPKYLFLLYPASEAVWEIRSIGADPSVRVLGLFPDKDIFIATNHALRSELGGWQSRMWKYVKKAARSVWRHLFHPYEPKITMNVADLVSGAESGKYFKE